MLGMSSISRNVKNTNNSIRLGILINPYARSLQNGQITRAMEAILSPSRIFQLESIQEIPKALSYLIEEQGSTVLGICGGDGSIHHIINALISWTLQRHQKKHPPPIIPILLLRGGRLNIVARALHIRGTPTEILRRFLSRLSTSRIHDLPIQHIRILAIETPSQSIRYGFVFGSELTARSLELYEGRFGAGYLGLARFLNAAVMAYFSKNKLWKKFYALLKEPEGILSIGGVERAYQALVASSIDIKLLGGFIQGFTIDHQSSSGMGIKILLPQSPRRMIRNLPNLLLGHSGKGILDIKDAARVHLTKAKDFSLDGEVFIAAEEAESMDIYSPAWSLPFIVI